MNTNPNKEPIVSTENPETVKSQEVQKISENDLFMLRRAHGELARAQAKYDWAKEEIGIRYKFTAESQVVLETGEIIPAPAQAEEK